MNFPKCFCAPAMPVLAMTCALFPLGAAAQTSFSAHTLYNSPDTLGVIAHGDFNNDGREDFVVSNLNGTASPSLLFLSNGDGTYDAPVTLPVAGVAGLFAVGDFNHDGKLDYAAATPGSASVATYLGNGNGTFTASGTIKGTNPVAWLAAADMNHDNKTDLLVLSSVSGSGDIQVWLSNGSGSFSLGQNITSGVLDPTFGAVTGDFDGDGSPDLAILYTFGGPTTIQVWYGNGKGTLGSPYSVTDPNGDDDRFDVNVNPVGDLNNDGKSDLLLYRSHYGASGTTVFYPQIAVFSGNSNRTLSFSSIATTNCPVGIQTADFTGDGINDLAYAEVPCSNYGGGPYTFVVKPGKGGGSFGAEQTIYSNPYYGGGDMLAVKSTQGTKPDLVFSEWTEPLVSTRNNPPQALVLLSNDSTGAFPSCGTIAQGEGLHVCTPSGATAASPVKFSISAAGPTPMRTVAVWADGKKVGEQLTHAFSNYSFMDQAISLSAGVHNITVFGTGWDNTLQQKSFSLTVSSQQSCAAPSGYGVNVCSPANGASVSSPVQVTATAKIAGTLARMEVWVDGVKKFTETTSLTLNTPVALAAGSHRFDLYAVNTQGTKYETTVYAAVK